MPPEKSPSIPPEGGSLLAQRYEIVRELGRGSMGVAVDPTGSNVAVTGIRVSIEPMWW